MSTSSSAAALNQTRQQRIETIMQQLRPKIEPTVRQMVERAVDVLQAQEFGAIDFEFRDAGQKLANEMRWHAGDEAACQQWSQQAKNILYEQGGEALLGLLQAIVLPEPPPAEVVEELGKLIGYLENNRYRSDYPRYRSNGWDIGSGPTEGSCKIIGECLKGSGMRWVEDGAATVAALRALYVSGDKVWDGFWAQPHRAAA